MPSRFEWKVLDHESGFRSVPSYFLVAVSTRENLANCIRHGLAGFPRSGPGLWAYLDIQVGDYVSFLRGARVRNLYRVSEKRAYVDASSLPPWPLLPFQSGKVYDFAYRLILDSVKAFDEPIARPEFQYIAEDLLLRGGYGKSHFQADRLTFHWVSSLEGAQHPAIERLDLPPSDMVPRFSLGAKTASSTKLSELVLQAAIRRRLSSTNLGAEFLGSIGIANPEEWEFLSEKALEAGHVDIVAKESYPEGRSRMIPIEIKIGELAPKDAKQAMSYVAELGTSAAGAALVGLRVSKKTLEAARLGGVEVFTFSHPDLREKTFDEIVADLLVTKAS